MTDVVLSDTEADRIVVLAGRGDGTFAAPVTRPGLSRPGAIGIADINLDGRADLIVAQPEADRVGLMLNRGGAKFTQPQWITVGAGPEAVMTRDLDRDGRADIVVVNRKDDSLSAILNRFDPDQVWKYEVTAADPDGDTVHFDLTNAPGGMLLDGATNTVYWAPMPEQVGANSVVLEASDGKGGMTQQGFTVTVTAPVAVVPPVFTSEPVTVVAPDTTYAYQPRVRLEDNAPARYSLIRGPQGMTIDPTSGRLEWDPRAQGLKLYANYAPPGAPVTLTNYGYLEAPTHRASVLRV